MSAVEFLGLRTFQLVDSDSSFGKRRVRNPQGP